MFANIDFNHLLAQIKSAALISMGRYVNLWPVINL